MEGSEGGGLVVRGRVEIDMRQPFSSVKEAISLFGEKVLAGEIYANKLKEVFFSNLFISSILSSASIYFLFLLEQIFTNKLMHVVCDKYYC